MAAALALRRLPLFRGASALTVSRADSFTRLSMPLRHLAILPQQPLFSNADRRKEMALRRTVELAERRQRAAIKAMSESVQFNTFRKPSELLRAYEEHRATLSPRDRAAALLAVGRLARGPTNRTGRDAFAKHERMATLRADVAGCVHELRPQDIANALLAASYMRVRDEGFLAPVCEHAATAVGQFSSRDLCLAVYALGRIGRADEALLRPLLGRIESEAGSLLAVEMLHVASGLAAVR